MNFTIQKTLINSKKKSTSPPPKKFVSLIDFSYTNNIYFSNLITSNRIHIVNVPANYPDAVLSLPKDSLLQYLFQNPIVGSLLTYTIEADTFPLQINSTYSNVVLDSKYGILYIKVTSINPVKIQLELVCSSSLSFNGMTGYTGPTGSGGPTGFTDVSDFIVAPKGSTGPTGP
jgi:hypothetical protein